MRANMDRVIGGDVINIEAPQDRQYLKFVVRVSSCDFDSINVRFYNSDGSAIKIDFSELRVGLVWNSETDVTTLGELEEVNKFEEGFVILGDFGTIYVYCDQCSPSLKTLITSS